MELRPAGFCFWGDDPNIVQSCAWVGHRHFAYDLIRNVKPWVVVELGTQMGISFFSCSGPLQDMLLHEKELKMRCR